MEIKRLIASSILTILSITLLVCSCVFHEIALAGFPIPLLVFAFLIIRTSFNQNQRRTGIWMDYLVWVIGILYIIPLNQVFWGQKWVVFLVMVLLITGTIITSIKIRNTKQ